jgi:hypothetical protein
MQAVQKRAIESGQTLEDLALALLMPAPDRTPS